MIHEIPLVCIILVNYKTEQDTCECIDSISDMLTYRNYKIIVVDNTEKIDMNNYNILKDKCGKSNCVYIRNIKNGGFAVGCNIGIHVAQKENAQYVLLLNNDTIIKSCDLIEQLLKGFSYHPNVGMVGGKIFFYADLQSIEKSEKENMRVKVSPWYTAGYISKLRLRAKNHPNKKGFCDTPFITGCMQMISMKAINSVGLLDESYFMLFEDADYCERMQINGLMTVYNADAQIYHKCSKSMPSSSPLSIYYSNRNRYIYMKKYRNNVLTKMVYFVELKLKQIIYKGDKKESINKVYDFISHQNL